MLLFLISCGTISVLTSGILRFKNPDSIDAVVNDSAKVNNNNLKSKLDTHQPKLHLITPPPVNVRYVSFKLSKWHTYNYDKLSSLMSCPSYQVIMHT